MFDWTGFNSLFSSTAVSTLGQRTRMHVGFAPQSGSTSGGYYSVFSVADGQKFQPATNAHDQPVVFLINNNAELPPIALALQATGKAAIVAEGNASDASVIKMHRLSLTDGVEVTLRLSELIAEDGTGGFHVNLVVPQSLPGKEEALEAALALARRADFKTSFTRQTLPARAVPPPERAYSEMRYPPLEYRLLAAFRIWGNINYFFPYKDLIGEDWEAVLKSFVPKMAAARDSLEYTLAVAEMVTHIHDSHGFIRSEELRAYFGAAPPPIAVRMIEDLPVVTSFLDETAARAAGIEIGDVILKVDGEEAKARIGRYAKYIAASTPHGLKMAVMWRYLNGADSSIATLTIRDRRNRVKEVKLLRTSAYMANLQGERSGDMLKLLPGNIGYADLDRLPVAMVDSMFERFKNTKAIVFDMRGYPLGTAWAISPRLTEKRNAAAAFFERRVAMSPDSPNGELMNEATSQTFVQRLPHSDQWKYKGKTVMLIDERTGSQAEHTGLFFEAANGTKFVGSRTMGANGDVTNFYVPGGILIHFTGQSVKHADGRQLQRLGLQPDVEVKPTIDGIRSGRDEELEKALEFIARGKE
jgi:C-terminal processing protease CtpA/Prc